MVILHSEYRVADYGKWRELFDSDPIGRKGAGVLRHRILRGVHDPNHVTVDLEFASVAEAEEFVPKLRRVLSEREGTLVWNPQIEIEETVEEKAA